MRSKRNSKDFRAMIPVLLNNRSVIWIFDSGETAISMEIPMRRYRDKKNWQASMVMVNFDRTERQFIGSVDGEMIREVSYKCTNSLISFDQLEDGRCIPVLR